MNLKNGSDMVLRALLFPKIYDSLIRLASADIGANDKLYIEKASWLRLVTESELGGVMVLEASTS